MEYIGNKFKRGSYATLLIILRKELINLISEYFIFDNIKSTDMGVSIVRVDSGLINTPFISSKDILEESVSRNPVPYFFRTKFKPLEFTVHMAITDENGWTPERRYELASWLCRPNYCELISDDFIGRRYFVIVTNQADLMTNGIDGYIQVQFRCQHPYALSPIYIETFDLSDNTTTTQIILDNRSNIGLDYYPELEVELVSPSTGFSLKNLSNNGEIFSFSNLTTGEIINISNEKKQIISSTGNYRYSKWNKKWFKLVQGKNTIEVTGKIYLQTRMTFPIFS